MRRSEARVLDYLNAQPDHVKYARFMSKILNIGYNYILVILEDMVCKGWITKTKYSRKVFYGMTFEGVIAHTDHAKNILAAAAGKEKTRPEPAHKVNSYSSQPVAFEENIY